ncbi:MAG: alpha/beta fold hydrolase [Bacteroidota bacterium]
MYKTPGAWYGSRNLLADTMVTNRFQVISFDRPGYDKPSFSGKHMTVTSINSQAAAIHEALRLNRSFKKGIIVGSSYGGPIAAKIAIDHPGEFYHLLLLAAAIDPDKEKFWWFNKYVHHGPLKWLLSRFLRAATNEKYTHVKELSMLAPNWASLTVPVTAVHGEADKIVSPANLDFAKKVLAGHNAMHVLFPCRVLATLVRWQSAAMVRTLLLEAPAE